MREPQRQIKDEKFRKHRPDQTLVSTELKREPIHLSPTKNTGVLAKAGERGMLYFTMNASHAPSFIGGYLGSSSLLSLPVTNARHNAFHTLQPQTAATAPSSSSRAFNLQNSTSIVPSSVLFPPSFARALPSFSPNDPKEINSLAAPSLPEPTALPPVASAPKSGASSGSEL